MAQLVTTKEKYGVSVAARIDPNLAHRIADRAENLGISMAKMLSLIIGRGFNPREPIDNDNQEEIDRLESEVKTLQDQLLDQRDLYIQTAAEFIKRISDDDDDQVVKVEAYNTVITEKKQSNDLQ